MAYKPRFSKRDDGGYDAAYGKGSKKITGIIRNDDGWHNVSGWPVYEPLTKHKKLKDAKAEWGEWAADVYENGDSGSGKPASEKSSGPSPTPPAPPKASGPPTYKPPAPPPYSPPAAKADDEYVADPFDPAMHEAGGKLTALGALDEVYHYIRRNPGGHFLPDGKTLRPPWDRVQMVLQRELGEDKYPTLTRV